MMMMFAWGWSVGLSAGRFALGWLACAGIASRNREPVIDSRLMTLRPHDDGAENNKLASEQASGSSKGIFLVFFRHLLVEFVQLRPEAQKVPDSRFSRAREGLRFGAATWRVRRTIELKLEMVNNELGVLGHLVAGRAIVPLC